MKNKDNLRPLNSLSPEEHISISAKGGRNKGKNYKERKLLKEQLLCLLESFSQNEEGEKENITIQNKICLALISKALNGNVKAFEVIRDTIGEKPTDKQEVNGTLTLPPTCINVLPVRIKE